MEPIVELAVRIASLLAFVREFFPDACTLDQVLAQWSGKDPTGMGPLEKAASENYSTLRTLQDFVAPKPSDEEPENVRNIVSFWKPGESDALSGEPSTLSQDQKRLHAAKLCSVDLYGRLEGLRKAFPLPLNVADPLQCRIWHSKSPIVTTSPRPIDLTREQIVDRAASAMLANQKSVSGIVEALSYKPSLIRQLSKFDGRLSESLLCDRQLLRDYCREQQSAVPFSFVFSDELEEICHQRPERLRPLTDRKIDFPNPAVALPREVAYQSHLFGVALSGGGIRSATFALGVLQGMADRNLLPFIDYLSTVSGGGYIGSWLIAWIKRRGSVEAVQQSLRGSATSLPCPTCKVKKPDPAGPPDVADNSDPRSEHVRPVRMLREYARYLAPEAGLFSADSWTILTTWLRNTMLSISVLILVLGSFLLLPRSAADLLSAIKVGQQPEPVNCAIPILLAGVPLWVACVLIGWYNLRSFRFWRRSSDMRGERGDNERTVVGSVLVLIVIGAFCKLIALWSLRLYTNAVWAAVWSAVVFFVGVAIIVVVSVVGTPEKRILRDHPLRQFGWGVIGALISATVGGLLIWALCSQFLQVQAEDSGRGVWLVVSVGFCLLLLILSIIVGLMIGIMSTALSDEQREWWSRLGAWVSIVIAAWLVVCGICFFSPLWIAQARLAAPAAGAAAGVSWLAIIGAGVKFAYSAKSGRDGDDGSQKFLTRAVMNLAPAVFVIGLLAIISFALYCALGRLFDVAPLVRFFLKDPFAHQLCCTTVDNYWALQYRGSLLPLFIAILLFLAGLFLDWRVDVNEFSMHSFYKNRLVRAYLGASRPRERRWPNAFTGFDMEDDIRLSRFHRRDTTHEEDAWTACRCGYVGPYPIINTTLNVTRGNNLASQERKAESFSFTPLWSGFDFTRKQTAVPSQSTAEYAFRPTRAFAFKPNGVFLGTAMAISGAAFNSNSGFHTSPSLSFLLTAFNIRLGWWIGNPAKNKSWKNSSPKVGLWCLLRELTAQTSTNSNYLLLSDGGHFENMGLYELVRRRCRYIVVSDAEEDAKFKLEGIGGAIRKCRVDFGVVIDLDLEALQPLGDPAKSNLHYSIGTISYPDHLPESLSLTGETQANPCGVLVYIKASVTGDEPVDVAEFRKRQPSFPNTSTANQFFDESHFESYRMLGQHAAQQVFGVDARQELQNTCNLVKTLQKVFCNVQTIFRDRIVDAEKKCPCSKDKDGPGREDARKQEG